MQSEDLVREVVSDSGKSMYRVSLDMGKSKLYIAQVVHANRLPTIRTMAEICDATGHDLLVRNRETGREIVIDPPERSDDE